MGLFGRKRANCTICNKEITHKHKAKKEWYVKSPLCADEKESNFKTDKDFCSICGCKLKAFNRFHPKSKWKLKGLLCKNCWDSQKIHEKKNRSN